MQSLFSFSFPLLKIVFFIQHTLIMVSHLSNSSKLLLTSPSIQIHNLSVSQWTTTRHLKNNNKAITQKQTNQNSTEKT